MQFGLTKKENQIFKNLDSPIKIQNFLDKVPINFEQSGQTCYSPRLMLIKNRVHCIEAAFFAAAVFWYHGHKPLLLDLQTTKEDYDHVVALFLINGKWGAISKSNHNVLRYRDPVYSSVRELAMSYFHEYFLDNGKKTLRTYSEPFDLRQFGTEWVTSEKSLIKIADALDDCIHHKIIDRTTEKNLRPVDRIEIKAGRLTEWKGGKKVN